MSSLQQVFRQQLQAHGTGYLHRTPPASPVFAGPIKQFHVARAALNERFPGARMLGYAVKVVDAQNTAKGVWYAVNSYFRWDAEGGRMYFFTRRFVQTGPDQFTVHESWARTPVTFEALFDDPNLDFENTANWVQGVCEPGTRIPLFACGRNVDFTEWYIGQTASLVLDRAADGIVMRQYHRGLPRSHYHDDDYVFNQYSLLLLSDAETPRRLATLAFVKAGATVLDLACGVGTVGGLVMSAASPANRWSVYFTDSSPKMVEAARDFVIQQFGQPPANESRFHVANVVDPDQRAELKRAFGRPNGFDVVIAAKFVNHFTEDSLRPLIVAMLDLCSPGGAVVFDMPLPCKYHQTVLRQDGRLTGGVMEISTGPIMQHVQQKGRFVTKTSPPIHGKDRQSPQILGSHFLRDADLEAAKKTADKAVGGILFAEVDAVTWERDRTKLRDETASIEAAAAASRITNDRVRSKDRDVRRDFVRHECGEQVGQSTDGSVVRRQFEAAVLVRVKKGSWI